jgi:CO/xanthine dehydrogenase Mo-binding subunit
MPFLGVAEAAQGPTAAALANAFADATGIRLRDLPFSRERVKTVIGVT